MKQRFTLLFVALVCMTSGVWGDTTIDRYSFTDNVFRQYVKDNFDKNHDGKLSDAEENAVKSIDLDGMTIEEKYGKEIEIIDGLYNFTNLTYLRCNFFEKMESLDVHQAWSLKTLDCSYCYKLQTVTVNEGLEELYLSSSALTGVPRQFYTGAPGWEELPNVKKFVCSYCPNLKALDIQMPKLEELNCMSCDNLTTLTLTKCQSLKKLECQFCAIKSLDTSGASKLEELWAQNNGMETFYANNSALKYIDLSNNKLTQLGKLGFLGAGSSLVSLDCSRNQLTRLWFSSNCHNLNYVDCSQNKIDEKAMYQTIKSLPKATGGYFVAYSTLNSDINYVNTEQVAMAKAKGWDVQTDNNEITDPYISYAGKTTTYVPVDDGYSFFPDAQFLAYLKTLDKDNDKFLKISEVTSIDVNNKGIADLTGLRFFTALTTLHCENNSLTTLDVSKNTKLMWLFCQGNKLTSLNMANNTKLTYLSCYLNQIEGENMDALITSLSDNTAKPNGYFTFYVFSSTKLNDANQCTQEQAARAKAKGWMPMCHESDTSTTPVEYAGISYADYIAIDETNFPDANFRAYVLSTIDKGSLPGYLTKAEIDAVTSINVSEQSITDLKGIEFFTALTSLNCSSNHGLSKLNLMSNKALTGLNCSYCGIYNLYLADNTPIKTLNFSGNPLTSLYVSQFLPKCTEIETLYCQDMQQLGKLDLSNMTKLTKLYCENAGITSLIVSPNAPLTQVWMATNNIGIDAMDDFIESLPAGGKDHFVIIYNTINSKEHNVCTFLQVDKLNAKNWSVHSRGKSTTVFDIYQGCGIPIIESVFPDENFRGFLKAQSYGTDGELSRSEINSLKIIDVNGTGVNSLKGIKYFTQLEELSCFDNPISELNVAENLKLRELYTYGTRIAGTAMSDLIASMNDNKGVTKNFRVYKPGSGNIPCSPQQVADAKAKGWNVLYYSDYKWQDITGYMSTVGIDREQLANEKPAEVYDLRGRKVNAQKKGLYIMNGKKVVIK